MVISIEVGDNLIRKVLVDSGSSADIVFTHCWDRMKVQGHEPKSCPHDRPLYGFGHNAVPVSGTVKIPVRFGTFRSSITKETKFYIVNTHSAYNMIMGRPTLAALQAIISIMHLKMKFPTPKGTGEARGDTAAARACYGSAMTLAQTDPANWQILKTQEKKSEKNRMRQ